MKQVKRFSALVAFLMSFSQTIAQISEGGVPISYTDSTCSPQNNIQRILLPTVNNDSLLLIDSVEIFNFGITLQANYSMLNSGTWDILSDGSRLWRLHLVSKGSYANYLLFSHFYIPDGAKLFVYNEDRSYILGAFTKNNNKPYQKFSLGPVNGESIILEYYEPIGVDTFPTLNISSLIHSYKNVYEAHIVDVNGNQLFDNSGACHINVRCPEGNGWCNQRRSVALIAMLSPVPGHFAVHCSGSLLTNERRDGRPYFLTARHCLDDNDNGSLLLLSNLLEK